LALLAVLLRRSRDFSPDFLASAFLYGLTVVNLTLLIVLVFVLGRHIARVVMEYRRGVLGAGFRMRLMFVLSSMAVVPSLLLIGVGSDLIQQTVDRWFNVDVERILYASQALEASMRESVVDTNRTHARLLASEFSRRRLLDASQSRLRGTVQVRARELDLEMVSVFNTEGELVALMDPRLPSLVPESASAERLVSAALAGRESEATVVFGRGELVRVAVPVADEERVVGAVVVSKFLSGELAAQAAEVRERYHKFRQAEASKEPIKAVYLSLFLLPALAILFGAVWLSLYLARRISVPLRLVAEGAERIASGERGVHVDFPAQNDEFAALIASFNRMSERLARSEEEVDHGRAGLTRKNVELEERRSLMETVLETVGTGIVVVDAEGTTSAANATARRLLGMEDRVIGRRLEDCLTGPGRAQIPRLVGRLLSGRVARHEREVQFAERGRERHLAVTIVPLPGQPGTPPGAVVVLDDLTPLIRAQKVAAWGEVARKLAHEVKNPLTPIQLSAQRIRRAYLKQAPDLERVVIECTGAIVQEVEALENLVDEFSQFARLPPINLVSASLREVIEQTLSLYDGQFAGVRFDRQLAPDLPQVRIDPAQIKRVLVNLVDNAIAATGEGGTVSIATEFERSQGRVRIAVSDDGPGLSPEAKEKLFVPSFSTKRHGTGLGLAIVNLIVREHQGVIRVEGNKPTGARFIVELPV
jgi:two-component system nitrogen regulation sensor histidine kinase NtrY